MENIKKAPDYLQDEHLSVGTKEYLKVLNSGDTPVESLPVPDARKVLENAQKSVDVDYSGIVDEQKTVTQDGMELKLVIVKPEGITEKLPVFLFIHGGGWVLGDYPTHKRLVRDLVVASQFTCVFIDYTRSPEAKFPTALNECYAAAKWIAANGDEINVDGSNLSVVGNSAGGNMTMGVGIKAKENNGPKIKALVAMWPYSDATTDTESYKLYGEQRFLTTTLMTWMRDNYLPKGADFNDIHISPDRATAEQLKGLPPTLVEVAENDILRDGGEQLGRKLDEAGVETTTIRFNGVTHDWGLLNGFAKISPVKSLALFSAAWLKNYMK